MWSVSVCTMPRTESAGLGDWTYSDMDQALNRFMNEVAATVKYAVRAAGGDGGPLASMYQEFVVDRVETTVAFRNYLMGDVDMCIPPALVLKEVVRTDLASWLHTLAKMEEKA
jgi:hypothetical protein